MAEKNVFFLGYDKILERITSRDLSIIANGHNLMAKGYMGGPELKNKYIQRYSYNKYNLDFLVSRGEIDNLVQFGDYSYYNSGCKCIKIIDSDPRYKGKAEDIIAWHYISGQRYITPTMYLTTEDKGIEIIYQKKIRIKDVEGIGHLVSEVNNAKYEMLKTFLQFLASRINIIYTREYEGEVGSVRVKKQSYVETDNDKHHNILQTNRINFENKSSEIQYQVEHLTTVGGAECYLCNSGIEYHLRVWQATSFRNMNSEKLYGNGHVFKNDQQGTYIVCGDCDIIRLEKVQFVTEREKPIITPVFGPKDMFF